LFEIYRRNIKMAQTGGEGSVELLTRALEGVRSLRSEVAGLFDTLAVGARLVASGGSTEERDRNFKTSFQTHMTRMVEHVKEMDSAVTGLSQPVGPFNLGNSTWICQDVDSNRLPLYTQLVDSYKWMEKVREYSGMAGPVLSANSLKRTYFNASMSAKRRRTLVNSYVVHPDAVNASIAAIAHSYNDMDINISRPLGANAVLNITLGRTLRAVVVLKGWLIEWVVVRGLGEDNTKEGGMIDLWTESRFKVFQKVTDNANAAMLHFCAPTHPELSVRSFMTWLHSYITLFTEPCRKCGLHLQANLPPTWRDLRSLDPYHEECKP